MHCASARLHGFDIALQPFRDGPEVLVPLTGRPPAMKPRTRADTDTPLSGANDCSAPRVPGTTRTVSNGAESRFGFVSLENPGRQHETPAARAVARKTGASRSRIAAGW
ncbi:hypothetical protein GCM10027079_04130 [Sediminivirga luteola]|uniref:Uncharacterized protein n=1 Tax=Sediminivirga luteola TaxID=1774748 RepID=A0A8J2TWZ1_9MICO|nr:hypothetical protein GCM10011333_10530 [Sediminivirga luteola]